MAEPAIKLEKESSRESVEQNIFEKDSGKRIQDTMTDELIIGLCGPIGTDIHNVSDKIKEILENGYGYDVIQIRLSRLIDWNTDKMYTPTTSHSPEFVRIKDLIMRGNFLREKVSFRVLAECAIKSIGVERAKQNGQRDGNRRKCYIIDSLKNKNEYDLLKSVYRDLFYSFGVFSPKELRVKNLKDRGLNDQEIYNLINQDSGEEADYGQSVSITFMLSDFFIRIDNNIKSSLESKLRRYFHLIFGTDIITPYVDETAMYLAASAGSNSGCLSRQVGAAVTDKFGEVLSVGWNDVPKFGGGVYIGNKSEHGEDHRCKSLDPKICFNSREKYIILENIKSDVLSVIKDYVKELEFLLQRELKDAFKQDLLNKTKVLLQENLIEKVSQKIDACSVKNLIEYSRSIHAEMHAIIKGAQKTASRMIGGKLYCTTFPCHNCARHIVMAGIHEVYYIEPYSKSLAEKLHGDSISSLDTIQNKVRIMMYDGVSPNRYLDLFKMTGDRKNPSPKLKEANPRYQLTIEDLKALESLAGKTLPANFIFTNEQIQ